MRLRSVFSRVTRLLVKGNAAGLFELKDTSNPQTVTGAPIASSCTSSLLPGIRFGCSHDEDHPRPPRKVAILCRREISRIIGSKLPSSNFFPPPNTVPWATYSSLGHERSPKGPCSTREVSIPTCHESTHLKNLQRQRLTWRKCQPKLFFDMILGLHSLRASRSLPEKRFPHQTTPHTAQTSYTGLNC